MPPFLRSSLTKAARRLWTDNKTTPKLNQKRLATPYYCSNPDGKYIKQTTHLDLKQQLQYQSQVYSQQIRNFVALSETKSNKSKTSNSPSKTSTTTDKDTNGNNGDDITADKASIRQLYEILKPERKRIQLAFLALLGSSSVTLSYPVLLGRLVDAFRDSGTTTVAKTTASATDAAAEAASTTSGSGSADVLFPLVVEHAQFCSSVIILAGVATFARLYLIETAIERTQFRLRQRFFGELLAKPLKFFEVDGHSPGALIGRLNSDITATSRVLIDLSQGTRSIMSASVGMTMVATLAPWDMLSSFSVPIVALFGGGFAYGRLVRKISRERQSRLALATQHAEERLSGLSTVRLFNQERKELLHFESKLEDVYTVGRQNALAQAGMSAIFISGGGLFLLSVFYNCGILIQTGVLSMGTAVSLGMYCVTAGSSLSGLAGAYGEVQKSLGACGKVLEVLGGSNVDFTDGDNVARNLKKSEEDLRKKEEHAGKIANLIDIPDVTSVPLENVFSDNTTIHAMNNISADENVPPLAVSFKDVHFSFPQRPDAPVLNGLTLDIPAGSRVAVLGRSGSGKSTIVQLLAGLYAPDKGEIIADNEKNIFDENESGHAGVWIRNQIGVISQDPLLFSMSIRENIEYGYSKLKLLGEDVVSDAAKTAYVLDFSDGLPEKLETSAGDRGGALSGGQRQRVCLARALARRPRMLVFDEATSALDLKSEALVHEALQKVLSEDRNGSGTTCLVITHRLSGLQFVDRIAVLDEGRVVQYGLKDDVLSNPGELLRGILESSGEKI